MSSISVLFVEDSREDMLLIDRLFKKAGLEFQFERVEFLSDLSSSLDKKWDIVISDYHLKGFTAEEVLKIVRDKSPNLPVIVMSGALGEEAAVAMMRAGASDYVVKSNLQRLPLIVEREILEGEERKKLKDAQTRLRFSEEMFTAFLNSVEEYAIFMLDSNGVILSWNLGAERITGYREREVIDKHFSLLFIPEDILTDAPQKELDTASHFGNAPDERWLQRKDSQRFWAAGTLTALKNEDGTIRGFAKVIRDITDRKEREEMKQLERAWLESALNLLPVPIFFAEAGSGAIRFGNNAFQKLVGVGSPIPSDFPAGHRLLKATGEEIDPKELPVARAERGEVVESVELIWEAPERRLNVMISAHLMPELHSRRPTVVASVIDITHLKMIEDELKKASEAKTQFLANMSHEIRTPLGAILGFTDLMRSTNLAPDVREHYGDVISRNGKLLSQLINDILDLSKIESGNVQVEHVVVSLPEILEEVDFLMRPAATSKGLELRILPVPESLIREICCDPTRLKQVLINLMNNSIKFTESGFIEVSLYQESASEVPKDPAADRSAGRSGKISTNRVGFKVRDTGVGISELKQSKLFLPFSQADASMTRRYGGTGLGLFLSRRICQALGGDLSLLESVEGVGSTFVASFPAISPSMCSHPDHVHEKLKSVEPTPDSKLSLKSYQILVVEDSIDNQLLIKVYLSAVGAKFIFCDDGEAAIEAVKQNHFDLIVMDVQLPKVDGYEATRAIRKMGFTMPIMALTAHALQEERQKSLDAGCDAHLTKPIAKHLFIREIKKLLGHQP